MIRRYSESYYEAFEDEDGDYVKYADHVASHAFDEGKERALFEGFAVNRRGGYGNLPFFVFARRDSGEYLDGTAELAWEGWKACAQQRASK